MKLRDDARCYRCVYMHVWWHTVRSFQSQRENHWTKGEKRTINVPYLKLLAEGIQAPTHPSHDCSHTSRQGGCWRKPCESVTGSKQDEQVTSSFTTLSSGCICVCADVFVCALRHKSSLGAMGNLYAGLKPRLPWQRNEMLIEWRPVWLPPPKLLSQIGYGQS